MDSLHNDSYEIKDEFGLVGVSVYFNILNNANLEKLHKIIPEKFLNNLAEFYFECFEKGNSDSLIKLVDIIKAFPENEKILLLINENIIAKKETLLIKLILDLKLHHFLNLDKLNFKGLNCLIYVMKKFYNNVSNENLKNISEKLKEDKNLKKYYTNDTLLNFSKKSNYFSELSKFI